MRTFCLAILRLAIGLGTASTAFAYECCLPKYKAMIAAGFHSQCNSCCEEAFDFRRSFGYLGPQTACSAGHQQQQGPSVSRIVPIQSVPPQMMPVRPHSDRVSRSHAAPAPFAVLPASRPVNALRESSDAESNTATSSIRIRPAAVDTAE